MRLAKGQADASGALILESFMLDFCSGHLTSPACFLLLGLAHGCAVHCPSFPKTGLLEHHRGAVGGS